jgi:redox-regulated HSP33 family molecular chaperone
VITLELATALAARGLAWQPASGDRFHIPDRDLDDEVFVVSGIAIEVSDLPSGSEMRFNGTVEWALDSIEKDEVVWLPREEQMREALGARFLRLERMTGEAGGFVVVLTGEERYVDIDVERAYARALLSALPAAAGPGSPS